MNCVKSLERMCSGISLGFKDDLKVESLWNIEDIVDQLNAATNNL